MRSHRLAHVYLLVVWCGVSSATECGPYGFVCEGLSGVRLCGGPAFLCPEGSFCNEASSAVCEDVHTYMGPALRGLRCRRAERLPDPGAPRCKGYVLCIPNRDRFQGIRFTCTGDTVFNALTQACTAPQHYRCPQQNATQQDSVEMYQERTAAGTVEAPRPIDCKDYRLSVVSGGPPRPAYFCPPRAPRDAPLRCTVFSDQFCIILERDPKDQHQLSALAPPPYREPRTQTRHTVNSNTLT